MMKTAGWVFNKEVAMRNLSTSIVSAGLLAAVLVVGLTAPAAHATPVNDSSLLAWFDAGQLTGLSNGDPVSTWTDASGNGNHATASAAYKEPTYITGALNGLPVVRFDASDDGLAVNPAIQVYPGFSGSDYSIFVVFNYRGTDTTSGRRAVQGSENWAIGPYEGRIVHLVPDGALWVTDPPPGGSAPLATQYRYFICEATTTATRSRFRVDGEDETSNTGYDYRGWPNYVFLGTDGLTGDSQPLDGDIAEVLIYNRVLTAVERNRVGVYLENKYGLDTAYGPNLALGADIVNGSVVIAGSSFNDSPYRADNVVDGKTNDLTRNIWLLGGTTGFLTIDLGESAPVNAIRLINTHQGSDNERDTRDFEVYAANALDGGNNLVSPELILSGTLSRLMGGEGDAWLHPDTFNEASGLVPGSYRYLEFRALNVSPPRVAVGLNEIEVYSEKLSGMLAPTIIRASGAYWELTGSAAITDGDTCANKVVDRYLDDYGDSWWLGRNDKAGENMVFDLGDKYDIDKIEFQNTHNGSNNDRHTSDFLVHASLQVDGGNNLVDPVLILDDVLVNQAGTGFDIPLQTYSVDDGDFVEFQARYIQFTAENQNAGLNEFRVYAFLPVKGSMIIVK